MIISHKYKFIFIKTAKTASTSIEVFLSKHCGDKDILTPIFPHVEPHRARNCKGFFNPMPDIIKLKKPFFLTIKNSITRKKLYSHTPANMVKNRVSKKTWDSYFKFCVERNPWDKVLSQYHMINYRSGGNISLDDFFNKGKFCTNYPLYMNKQDDIIVDKIIKYENLNNELSKIFNQLKIPFDGDLGVRAKSNYRENKKHYSKVFNDKQRQIIEDYFQKEIEIHNYKF